MSSTVLLTQEGTRAAVLAALRTAAKALKSGDYFFLTYSGHGGQVADVSGDDADKQDETWCLFDGQLIDDELYVELSRFAKGVRILVLSDSCHSGTVTRAVPPPPPPGWRAKLMPAALGARVYRDNKDFYDGLQKELAGTAGAAVDPDLALSRVTVSPRLTSIVKRFNPAVVLISGCQDNQVALDGDHNGAFTEQLLAVWNNGQFNGSYAKFHERIKVRLPGSQTPNLFALGNAATFLQQQVFKI
jgi:hypothetical protein